MANRKVEPRLPPVMHAYLQDLVDLGAYGSTPSDVARALIEEGIRRAITQRVIAKRRTSRGGRADGEA